MSVAPVKKKQTGFLMNATILRDTLPSCLSELLTEHLDEFDRLQTVEREAQAALNAAIEEAKAERREALNIPGARVPDLPDFGRAPSTRVKQYRVWADLGDDLIARQAEARTVVADALGDLIGPVAKASASDLVETSETLMPEIKPLLEGFGWWQASAEKRRRRAHEVEMVGLTSWVFCKKLPEPLDLVDAVNQPARLLGWAPVKP